MQSNKYADFYSTLTMILFFVITLTSLLCKILEYMKTSIWEYYNWRSAITMTWTTCFVIIMHKIKAFLFVQASYRRVITMQHAKIGQWHVDMMCVYVFIYILLCFKVNTTTSSSCFPSCLFQSFCTSLYIIIWSLFKSSAVKSEN